MLKAKNLAELVRKMLDKGKFANPLLCTPWWQPEATIAVFGNGGFSTDFRSSDVLNFPAATVEWRTTQVQRDLPLP